MRIRWVIAGLIAANAALLSFVACGARSGLPIGEKQSEGGGGGTVDAGPDAPEDAPKDSPIDVPVDVPDDVPDFPDATTDCADPSTTFIYLVTSENELLSFNPANKNVHDIGTLACPSNSSPFSMGVDRKGIAFVEYADGTLFKVSTKNAACKTTDFVADQSGFQNFGMGFSLDAMGGDTDQLFVAEISFAAPSKGLGTIDTKTLDLTQISNGFNPSPANELEMTGSSDGNLWAYFLDSTSGNGAIAEIDKTSGDLLQEIPVNVGLSGASSLAFAFWGGDFYIFTSAQGTGSTTITKFDMTTMTQSVFGSVSGEVVGSGVSTCAPAE